MFKSKTDKAFLILEEISKKKRRYRADKLAYDEIEKELTDPEAVVHLHHTVIALKARVEELIDLENLIEETFYP